MKHRPERASSLIKEELALIIERSIETPGALATITDVEVTKDMEHASVYVSVFPTNKGPGVLKLLTAARQDLQWKLTKKMNIRPMPSILFKLDEGMENAARVEKKLIEGEKN